MSSNRFDFGGDWDERELLARFGDGVSTRRGRKFLDRIFESKMAKAGGIVRRKRSSIDNQITRGKLLEEVMRRGFHILEIGDQWVIICNKGKLQLII